MWCIASSLTLIAMGHRRYAISRKCLKNGAVLIKFVLHIIKERLFFICKWNKCIATVHAQARGFASPPGNLKVKKTKVIRGNFKLFHLYFATLVFSLTHNFLSYFLSSVPPEKKKENGSLSDLVNNFVLIIFKTCKYSYKKFMLLYIATRLPWGFGIMFPVNISKKMV